VSAVGEKRAVAAGRSLALLYEEHIRRAISLARLLTGDDAVAKDVAHEAFIRAIPARSVALTAFPQDNYHP
jgi:DNA-directed RNA polymerase specialized sigma24 family protein